MILFLLFIPSLALAGWADIDKTKVFCEHYLSEVRATNAVRELQRETIGRPFTFAGYEAVKPRTLKILKLEGVNRKQFDQLVVSLAGDASALQPLTLRLQFFSNGSLSDIYSHSFPDETPSFWKQLYLESGEESLSYSALAARYRIPKSPKISDGFMGFHTDPDLDGVRVFLAAHEYGGEIGNVALELGLDVPCNELDRYVDVDETPATALLTNVTKYCRFTVLTFGRGTAE